MTRLHRYGWELALAALLVIEILGFGTLESAPAGSERTAVQHQRLYLHWHCRSALNHGHRQRRN